MDGVLPSWTQSHKNGRGAPDYRRDRIDDEFRWIRAALYLACTPAMFGFTSILVWPGCMLVLTAFLYVLVSLKYRAGGGVPSYSQVPQAGEDEGPSFGTFTL